MFRELAKKSSVEKVVNSNPLELAILLELVWNSGPYGNPNNIPLMLRDNRDLNQTLGVESILITGIKASELDGKTVPENLKTVLSGRTVINFKTNPEVEVVVSSQSWRIKDDTGNWYSVNRAGEDVTITSERPFSSVSRPHLVYACMIENTRIYEIFQRVVHEFRHGEKLGTPSEKTQRWLRNTEELFYRDPPAFSILNVASRIRPDMRATRRNAYWRMFGMDLNHGSDDGSPYPYVKADAANKEFVATFEELLREVWIGITYRTTTTAPNPTDASKISNLAEKLKDMLLTRRKHGNLAREEFLAVSMMSWFHLTVEHDLPIIEDLRATAQNPEQRLFAIAERVGLSAHGLSKSYFDIAEPLSTILSEIEKGTHNTVPSGANSGVDEFYKAGGALEKEMRTVITHWSIITGRDIKAIKVTP